MIALSILLLATLCPQEPGQRKPVDPSSRQPLRTSADQSSAQVALPRNLHSTAELRVYDLEKLSGYQTVHELAAELESSANSASSEETLARFQAFDRARKNAETTTEHLVSTIRDLITPPLIPELHDVRHLEHGRIALFADFEQHAWIEGFLRAAEAFQGLINLQATIYKLEGDQLAGLPGRDSGSVLTALGVEELLTDIRLLGIEEVTSPQIHTLPFQQARLSILSSTAYVKDFELTILPDLETEIADPVIDIIHSGLLLNFRGVPLADDQLGIFVDLELSKLDSPIPSADIVIGAGRHEVTVQLPQVTRIHVEGHFEVQSGESLLLTAADPTGTSEILVLLKTTRE